jgi:hypothetical protein
MDRTRFDTPVTKVVIQTFDSFRITEVKVNLESSAVISVIVYNTLEEFDNFIEKIYISDEAYAQWGEDDAYIKEYVKNYLQEKYTNTYA